jgi:peptidase M48-like protein
MRNGARAVPMLLTVLSAVAATAGEKESRSDGPATRALAFFETDGATSIPEFLARHRPAPLSAALRAQVLASLPPEGELQATAAERAKLAALAPVLDLHGQKGTVEIKVIEVGHAFVGLHARTVLLLSRDALALVTPEELQAVTGHELGHEYVWNEYQAAMAAAAHPRMQELELVCDGIAVISQRALGLDPARLIAAVTKMTRYNQRLGATASARSYVPLDERRRFIDAVSARTGAWAAALLRSSGGQWPDVGARCPTTGQRAVFAGMRARTKSRCRQALARAPRVAQRL